MNRKVIYSAIFGNYDAVKIHSHINKEYDYVLFSDSATISAQSSRMDSSNWTVINMGNVSNPRLLARELKVLNKVLGSYSESIWLDGKYKQIGDINDLFENDSSYFTTMTHPSRSCVYKEAEACVSMGRGNKDDILTQIERYQSEGLPKNIGMVNSAVIRRFNTPRVNAINEGWWNEIENGSIRDQISFNYVLWKLKEKIHIFDHNKLKGVLQEHKHLI